MALTEPLYLKSSQMSSSSLVEKFEFFVTVERAGLCLGLEDQADQLTLDHDGLHQLLALGQLGQG